MSRIRLKYVQAWVDREGRAHHYFRRRGFPRVRLPGLPGSADLFDRFLKSIGIRHLAKLSIEAINMTV
jgi:hypothetical protein